MPLTSVRSWITFPPSSVARFVLDATSDTWMYASQLGGTFDPAALEPYLIEGRGIYHGRSSMLLRPGSTAEVQAILKRHGVNKPAPGEPWELPPIKTPPPAPAPEATPPTA